MEKRKVTVCFSENKHVFYGKQEVGLIFGCISGCISGCLPWIPFWNIASGGSEISEKTRSLDSVLESCLRRVRDLKKNTSRETKHAYIAYIAHIRPYSPISAPYRPH